MAVRVTRQERAAQPRPPKARPASRVVPLHPVVGRTTPLSVQRAWALDLQRTVGNAAFGALIGRSADGRHLTVSRCAPEGTSCGCAGCEKGDTTDDSPVQRQPLGPSGDPFQLGPQPDRLEFTKRSFFDQSQPTVCPRCHDQKPSGPQFPKYVDQEATEPRLVSWGQESEQSLQHSGSVRSLQLDPPAADTLVDDYGAGLTKRITASHEFKGSQPVREKGAETIRRRWPDIRPIVHGKLSSWYQDELITAVGMTPKWASPVLQPDQLRSVLDTRHGGTAPMGRWDAVAVPGRRYGVFDIVDIGNGLIWFHLPDRPLWLYQISKFDFIRHDPFLAAVAQQVHDQTKWILQVTPLLLKAGAFALGLSGSLALVIAAIAIDELATEMQSDAEGGPGRTPLEILESAGMQLLVDRIFHGLMGGSAGRVAAGAGRTGAKIEKIAERSLPAIRRELANAEKPLVKQAMEAGTARRVADKALKAEGYTVEVAIETGGKTHIYRLNSKGRWCRFSNPVCDLDLGSDVAAAAASPTSFTESALKDARALMGQVKADIELLSRVYDRMRAAGRMDVSLLSPAERVALNELAPSGDAARLTLAELRDLPRKLGLKKDFAAAAADELRLVQQLYREGHPLYEIMRAASPSYAASSRVLADAGGRDAASLVLPRSGALDVDHIVSLNDIVRMKGFKELRPERQLALVNDVKNLRAIDHLANRSRGARSWAEWPQASLFYEPAALARMRALETELRLYLEGRIAALSRP